MPVLVAGLSHRGASLDLLERLAITEDLLPKALHQLRSYDHIHECVILSTCNRVEMYVAVTGFHAGVATLRQFLADIRHVDPAELSPAMYAHYEEEAVRHVFGVAAGIDSMVLGEEQVLAQARAAFRTAGHERTAGPVLNALFRNAIRVGRRARAETAIGRSVETFATAGARLAERELGGLEGKTVLVVGAGKMSDLATQEMGRLGATIFVANRTASQAHALAARTGGTAVPMSKLGEALGAADLVVSSTGAPEPVITPNLLAGVMHRRRGGPLVILDLAVPRDVDPACAGMEGVVLRDLDALRRVLKPQPAQLAEAEKVRAIVTAETPKFMAWQRAHRLAPLMEALQSRAESVRSGEIERAASKLAALDDREREAVDALTRAIVAKLLHRPVVTLKATSGSPEGDALAKALMELFDLDS